MLFSEREHDFAASKESNSYHPGRLGGGTHRVFDRAVVWARFCLPGIFIGKLSLGYRTLYTLLEKIFKKSSI
jgi:hypothetical protein